MDTLIINIDSTEKSLLVLLLKKFKAIVKEINEDDKEDYALVRAMMKGRKHKYVSESSVLKKLRK
ncbi:MAG: hypothetical protein CO118_08995 [Flavobacteriales bacterium CG_4_9_14_3_um_filter_32_8]|nr:MAG: hypothetical protein CO118_08995 [Flavobacteriales bacterium CG_4_9_14_3_um_filter_32_8]